MDTDQLIRTLAEDNAHRARPVGFALMLALMAAAPVSLLMFFTELGIRPDVMTAMRNPFFDLKFAVTLALAIAAIAVSLHLSRPEASLRGLGWLLLIPAGLLTAGIGSEMMMPQRLPMMTRLVGNNSRVCMTAIPLLSLPILAAALIGLRHGAPARPAVAGAIAGMLSAGLAATLYASHCTDDSPLFVATWYTIATALVTADCGTCHAGSSGQSGASWATASWPWRGGWRCSPTGRNPGRMRLYSRSSRRPDPWRKFLSSCLWLPAATCRPAARGAEGSRTARPGIARL
jgi:hypothetical protein